MPPFFSLDWPTVVQLLIIWGGAIGLAVVVLDRLFPRLIRRDPKGGDTYPAQFDVPLQRRGANRVPLDGAPGPSPRLPRLPPVVIEETSAVVNLDPAQPRAYWRGNLSLIGALLIVWAAVSFLPIWLAPALNQFTILTGFPLGYYIGAQGALVVFLAITLVYTTWMTQRDRACGSGRRKVNHALRRTVFRRVGWFLLTLVAVILSLVFLETQFRLSPSLIEWAFIGLTVGLYMVIGLSNRTTSLDEYYVAGRRIPAIFNGLAIAADWMSAATFISLAGTLWLLGYEGLAYILGWTGGYVLLLLLLAPYLRKFGQYTIPDLIGARFASHGARITAAVMATIVSFVYLTAQVMGVGIIMSRFLGVNYILGVLIGLGAVLFCSYLGGMKAITWTQVAQGIILILAFLTPVVWLSYRDTGVPLPQLMYGEALQNVARLEGELGISKAYADPFNDWTPWHFVALTICLMCGTAGLPHILTRIYTTPTVRQARRSVSWALVFIVLIYLTIPAYAAFSRWEFLQHIVGQPFTALPAWATNWVGAGLLRLDDANGDGVLQYTELDIHPDLVVLATPEILSLPHTIVALVAVGGLAAALSTADGLLMVITAAAAHDIYFTTFNRRASARRRLQVGRAAMLFAAVLASLTALRRLGIIVELVAWAFSLAAATIFPALVLSIFWKRANRQGVVAGMISGLLVTLAYIVLVTLLPATTVAGITSPAAGIFGMPVNFLATIVVSLLTAPPPRETQTLVDALRRP